jgi:phospholipid/cholesterol/gamma-HCH transport system permease protein
MADEQSASITAFEPGPVEQEQSTDAPARPSRLNIFAILVTYLGEVSLLLGQALKEIFRGRIDGRDLIQQMAFIGVNSVAIALITSFASGAVIALYFSDFLQKYGVTSLVGAVVAISISRELGPVLTGVVVAARAGSAIAAEIGTMKVTEQIDALRALAVNPVQYLVPPRLIAAVIMLPIVCILADMSGIIGGYVIAVIVHGVPSATYPNGIRQFLVPSDFYLGMIKTVFFGLIIAIVGCHQGLKTRGGATEVGRATTSAVVLAIVLIYISDFFLANALFTNGGSS